MPDFAFCLVYMSYLEYKYISSNIQFAKNVNFIYCVFEIQWGGQTNKNERELARRAQKK